MAQHSKYARICLQRVLNISHTIHSLRSLSKVNVYSANIHLDEDVLKTSFIFVFRRRLHQDEHALALRLQNVFKTFWSRLIYSSWLYVFKTFSRRLGQDQYIPLGYTSSRRLQDIFKTPSRRFQDDL